MFRSRQENSVLGLLLLFALPLTACAESLNQLPVWRAGFLDIHHIHTGRGNATFFVFPDGTTMLFDAGELAIDEARLARWDPLEVAPLVPNASRSAGEWLVDYIQWAMPSGRKVAIDFAIISHFHGDHYGGVDEGTPQSSTGAYQLSGITRVGDSIPISTLIDRGAPDYSIPTLLEDYFFDLDATLSNYRAFTAHHQEHNGLTLAPLEVGSISQIQQLRNGQKYNAFFVRNIKSNAELWTGDETESSKTLFDTKELLKSGHFFNGNPLSIALTVSYGDFDYYTGGDSTGLQGASIPTWFDVETPMAGIVGEVDALSLNHHGNRDATNATFLSALRPQTIVQQSWISDHPGGEVVHRMISTDLYEGSRDIFATFVHDATRTAIGPWLSNNYHENMGHVVIRVSPGGEEYVVFVLDAESDQRPVISRTGPTRSRN